MQVQEIMTRGVEVVHPDSSLQEAAHKMCMFDIGALPVHDGVRLVGLLTDRDIALRSVAEAHDPREDRVRDAMRPVGVSPGECSSAAGGPRNPQPNPCLPGTKELS